MRPAQLLYIRQGSSLLVRVVGVAYLGSPAEWKSAAFSEVFGTSSVNNHFPFPTGTWMTSLRRHFSAPNDERKMRMSFPIWCKLAKFPLRVFDQATGKSHVNFFGVAMMISFSSIFFSRFVFFSNRTRSSYNFCVEHRRSVRISGWCYTRLSFESRSLRKKRFDSDTESGADAKQCFQRSWVSPIAGWFISMENPNFIPKLWMVYNGKSY